MFNKLCLASLLASLCIFEDVRATENFSLVEGFLPYEMTQFFAAIYDDQWLTVGGSGGSGGSSDSQEINGRVNSSGSLSATLGNTEDREFIGQLSGSNEASGTWVDTGRDFSGSWVGQKN